MARSTPERWQVLHVFGRSVARSGAIRLSNSALDSAVQSAVDVGVEVDESDPSADDPRGVQPARASAVRTMRGANTWPR